MLYDEIREVELLDPHGNRTGCFRRMAMVHLCDHEHNEGESGCEDARVEMSRMQKRH